jgi:rhamnulokinase
LINPDAADFVAPKDMPAAIREFCRKTNQPLPETDGAVVRCALESLAMRYRQVLGWLEQLTGSTISTIHVVGGGTQNEQLSQMASSACNRQVVAGPIEATAIGNAMMQAIALGAIGSIADARRIVAESFAVKTYEPESPTPWDEAYVRFERLT